ncbi:MAG TPA: hypothetical protein DCP11_07685 [Microbacteriaceae bacterium]|jgi:hypothetical protein|nr:hypothetical protein [Microbacteriaceae bacterium]
MANLAERIGQLVTSLGVRASYGEKITIDGAEAVPVALVWFGFGGGSDESGEAGGGGGGGATIPIGVYTGGINGPRFQPNLVALLAVSIPLTLVAGKALSHIVRALKK